MAAPTRAPSQGVTSEATNPWLVAVASSLQSLVLTAPVLLLQLGKDKRRVCARSKQGVCSSPPCHSLPQQNFPEKQEQQLSSGDARQQSGSFHKKSSSLWIHSTFWGHRPTHFTQRNPLFLRLDFLKCCRKKKDKRQKKYSVCHCFRLQN